MVHTHTQNEDPHHLTPPPTIFSDQCDSLEEIVSYILSLPTVQG